MNEYVRDNHGLLDALQGLSDDEWLNIIIQSIYEPSYAGFELPRVPPEQFQKQFNRQAGQDNLRVAFEFYAIVKKQLACCGANLNPSSRVLDFGCGWGRVTRMFLKDVLGDNLYGIDVGPAAIEMCQQTMPYGTFRVNPRVPPTDFPPQSFDLICAYSVFSHLPEPIHMKWIEEFARILKGGGVLAVTTLPRSFIQECQSFREQEQLDQPWQKSAAESFIDAAAAFASYDRGQFLFSPQPADVYGMSLIPRAYVEREWTRFFEVRDFIDARALLPQALIVMQKPRERTHVRAMSE